MVPHGLMTELSLLKWNEMVTDLFQLIILP